VGLAAGGALGILAVLLFEVLGGGHQELAVASFLHLLGELDRTSDGNSNDGGENEKFHFLRGCTTRKQ